MIHERWPEKVPCIPLLSQRWWDTFTNLWPRWYPPNVSPFAKVTNPQFSGENISPATSPRSQCRLHFSLRHLAGTQRSIDFVLTHIGVVVNCQANLWGSGGKHNSWVSWCFGWRLRVLGSHWGWFLHPATVTTRTRHFQEGILSKLHFPSFHWLGEHPFPAVRRQWSFWRAYLFCQPYSHFGEVVCIWGRNDSPKWIRWVKILTCGKGPVNGRCLAES